IYAAPGQTIYRQIILSIRIVLKVASPRTNATPTTGYPMINRRRFLTTSTLAAASLAAPGLVSRALAQSEALKIGVPVPISGAFAANGKFATIGAVLAAEEVAAAHGIEVSTLDLDTEGKPATAVRKVQDALAQ